jgi:hypothetical protein
MPIYYYGRVFSEGKKITWRYGAMARGRFFNPLYSFLKWAILLLRFVDRSTLKIKKENLFLKVLTVIQQ